MIPMPPIPTDPTTAEEQKAIDNQAYSKWNTEVVRLRERLAIIGKFKPGWGSRSDALKRLKVLEATKPTAEARPLTFAGVPGTRHFKPDYLCRRS